MGQAAPALPAEASDQWDPNAYRASLAGKSVAATAPPRRQGRDFVETASLTEPQVARGRMSLTAAQPESEPEAFEAPQPFAPAQTSENEPAYDAGSTLGPATDSGRAYVQIGIFRDRSNAERLRRELGSLGPVEVAPLQVGDGAQVFRVRVGPFSQGEASRAQGRIATYGVANTAIVTD